ncbi:Short-chain dehydrogenase [Sphingobium faniae]|nr:Short-chain dehydrogenase [Sphingobium faniae]
MAGEQFGQWGLIVGGSDGIGLAFAHELAQRGVNLLLIARRADRLTKAANEIAENYPGITVCSLALDMEDEHSIDRIVEETSSLEIGTFIYNAGAETDYRPFVEDEWNRIAGRMQRNVIAQTRLLHHFGRAMCARERGSIITMGSISGSLGSPGFAFYGATKAFIHNLSEALWFEFKQCGVRLLCPIIGPTATPAMHDAFGPLENAADPAHIARGAMDRLGEGPFWIVDDVAQAIADFSAMNPADRATLGAAMMRDFVDKSAGG